MPNQIRFTHRGDCFFCNAYDDVTPDTEADGTVCGNCFEKYCNEDGSLKVLDSDLTGVFVPCKGVGREVSA